MSAYWVIFAFILVGVLLQRAVSDPHRVAGALNQVVIYVCLPALILMHVPSLELEHSLLPLVLIPWTLLGLTVAIVLPLTRSMGWSREVRAVLLVLLPLGNTSFLGFPLTQALLGPSYMPLAVVYDQFGSFLMVSTYVLWVVAWYGSGEPPRALSMLERLVRFPPFIALIVGLAIGDSWLGDVGLDVLTVLAKPLLPMVTLAIGLSLQWRLPQAYLRPLVFGVTAKLVILPAITFVGLWVLGQVFVVSPEVARVGLLEASMPAMITAAALLSQAHLAPALASAMVAWSVVLSVATVPLWFGLGFYVWGQ